MAILVLDRSNKASLPLKARNSPCLRPVSHIVGGETDVAEIIYLTAIVVVGGPA